MDPLTVSDEDRTIDLDEENRRFRVLLPSNDAAGNDHGSLANAEAIQQLNTAPLVSLRVRHHVSKSPPSGLRYTFSQYALLGQEARKVLVSPESSQENLRSGDDQPNATSLPSDAAHVASDRSSPLLDRFNPIFLNTNAPWSAFLCGSQGSGKSYTLSCILENCLLKNRSLGETPSPMSAVVFNYSTNVQNVCEAVYLASHVGSVNVVVHPTSFYRMLKKYEKVAPAGKKIHVTPLFLKDDQLKVTNMKQLMAFNTKEETTPLYMEVCPTNDHAQSTANALLIDL